MQIDDQVHRACAAGVRGGLFPGTVFALALLAGCASDAPPAPIGGGAVLVVETTPPGAEVLVDGTLVGETPLEHRDIDAGMRDVVLRHPHYEMVRTSGRFEAGRVMRIERTLVRGRGAVTVLTVPSDAWVEVDGRRLEERTPVTLEDLPAGPLELTLGALEHRPLTVSVEIPNGGLARLNRTLDRLDQALGTVPQGTLTLELEPPDAAVTLPDIAARYEPGMHLPEGPVRVLVSRSGYEDAERMLEVSGETLARIELSRPQASFTVDATPASARVRLPDHGVEYRAGMPLPAGDYRVEVSAEGYRTVEFTVRHGTSATRREVSLERATPMHAGTRFRDALSGGGEGPEMVVVPPGSFRMGCLNDDDACDDDEKPVRVVNIGAPFALSRTEVTFAEWGACIADGGCGGHRPDDGGWGRGDRPVINVSWEDARAYTAWLSRRTGESYRLPSEAEWEYAARAGASTKYHWSDRVGRNLANCRGCGSRWDGKRTAPVGSFSENAWGLHDMHGNVWEWMQDCWNESYQGAAPTDGSAWLTGNCSGRVLRGGSWGDDPKYLRASYRYWYDTGMRDSHYGFRVARGVSQTPSP